MWTGYEADRDRDAARGHACAAFCDTAFTKEGSVRLSAEALADEAARVCGWGGGRPPGRSRRSDRRGAAPPGRRPTRRGPPRPGLRGRRRDQRDRPPRRRLRRRPSAWPDWVVCSPKLPANQTVIEALDELKLVVPAYRPSGYAAVADRVRPHFLGTRSPSLPLGPARGRPPTRRGHRPRRPPGPGRPRLARLRPDPQDPPRRLSSLGVRSTSRALDVEAPPHPALPSDRRSCPPTPPESSSSPPARGKRPPRTPTASRPVTSSKAPTTSRPVTPSWRSTSPRPASSTRGNSTSASSEASDTPRTRGGSPSPSVSSQQATASSPATRRSPPTSARSRE